MENILMFAVGGNGGAAAAYPARNFLGCEVFDGNTMQISFKKEDGTADAAIVSIDFLDAHEACKALAGALAGNNRGLTIVADGNKNKVLYPFVSANLAIA
tara:strand:+ start:98 stop:397 length:300 start_codon:yes stop_codon:yes gene_type:complete